MVDVTAAPESGGSFMGRTRGALRSMRSVLGGGGEYLQGLSNRLNTALSSSVEDSEPTTLSTGTSQTSKPPPAVRMAAANAINGLSPLPAPEVHDEFLEAKKKLRFPRFGTGINYEDYETIIRRKFEQQEMSRCARISRKNPGMSYEEIASSRSGKAHKKAEVSKKDDATQSPDKESVESTEPKDQDKEEPEASAAESYDKFNSKVARAPNRYQTVVFRLDVPSSSESTSDADYGPTGSIADSTDGRKDWQRSGSSASIQSWASSLSADSQSEEAAVEFMKKFVPMLFDCPSKIDQEQKANFGQMVLTEPGRIWFSRVVNARRGRPCVTEESFYSLAQHFAVALFECHEADDFAPAKSLMNMCFTFYHEIEVPGVEPYREYLYTNLRVQPIWSSMRFWTAAFFDAVQCERAAKIVPPRWKSVDRETAAVEDRSFHANIVFGQLGTFTCNMHAFGLPRNLCLEFLKKQCTIANLTSDQSKMLKDNIERMYDETDPWRN
ncbi:uncharacterized protein KIAA0513 [Copidosoma floridanum]|uniref:uncharacterized protein KIAA0513 n=1 Tax=Copidosoma floridanum TaxID=29053 RepID=UPI0006C9C037|nr:uncharacterized protein KIAA0513 [Copidosoma floridanum]